MNEEWKPVKGYEGLYEVSSLGRVRGVSRVVPRFPSSRFVTGVIRKLQVAPNGYMSVSLRNLGRSKRFYVHRLVAEAFIENPLGLREVNHRDENKGNNNVENLEWCSHSYNMLYAGGSVKRSEKLSKPVVVISDGVPTLHRSMSDAGRHLGVSTANISRCCHHVKNQIRVKGCLVMFRSEYERNGV